MNNFQAATPFFFNFVACQKHENKMIKTVLITGATFGVGPVSAELLPTNLYLPIIAARCYDRLTESCNKLKDVAKAIMYAIPRPSQVNIGIKQIRPTAQVY